MLIIININQLKIYQRLFTHAGYQLLAVKKSCKLPVIDVLYVNSTILAKWMAEVINFI